MDEYQMQYGNSSRSLISGILLLMIFLAFNARGIWAIIHEVQWQSQDGIEFRA
jgi:hypothetical protein